MPRQLNDIDANTGAGEVIRYTKFLDARLGATPGPTAAEKERHFTLIGQFSLWLGLYGYMLEYPEKTVVGHFGRAADAFQSMFELRPEPNGETGGRGMRRFEQTLALAVCFGSTERARTIKNIDEWAYRHPSRPEEDAYALYLNALKIAVSNRSIDRESTVRALEAFKTETGSATPNMSVASQTLALSALGSKETAEFNVHLTNIVHHHEIDAKTGELADSQEGFISLEAMALAGLARQLNVAVTVKSIYLPLHLLEVRVD